MTASVSIIGAAGLSGLELIKRLARHPHVQLKHITSSKYQGQALAQVFPQFHGLDYTFEAHDCDRTGVDFAFLAVPNKASLELVPDLVKAGIRVIDLSGVYRIQNTQVFSQAYKLVHDSTDLLREAVFGLPEVNAKAIASARLIANPGCYPTGALLGLIPLGNLLNQLSTPPIIDAKSGVTGAGGRVEDDSTNYVNCNENFKAYKVFNHQHTPEIRQVLNQHTPYQGEVIFTPHLLPVDRGILSTIYLQFSQPQDPKQIRDQYAEFACNQPFVQLLPEGQTPEIKWVQHTNRCQIGLHVDPTGQRVIVITAIDNLVKGASGQAIQNLNLMLGCDQTLTL